MAKLGNSEKINSKLFK
jgi:hypothetical protein